MLGKGSPVGSIDSRKSKPKVVIGGISSQDIGIEVPKSAKLKESAVGDGIDIEDYEDERLYS